LASQAEALSGDRHGEGGAVGRGGQALALATLCTLLFLTFLDNTVVSVALGDVQTSLKANVADLQWVVGAYALTFASIMLACGMIGDELGRKRRKGVYGSSRRPVFNRKVLTLDVLEFVEPL